MAGCLGVFIQAEDGIRDRVRSRGLGDVYKRQAAVVLQPGAIDRGDAEALVDRQRAVPAAVEQRPVCLLYTSDAADERSSVDLGGRRIIKKKNQSRTRRLEPEHPHYRV